MDAATSSAPAAKPRAALFATHDTTIVPMSFTLPGYALRLACCSFGVLALTALAALCSVYDPHEWSPFAANIVLELLEHTPKSTASAAAPAAATPANRWYVRVLSNGKPAALLTLDQLKAHWKPWVPVDWEKECKPNHSRPIPEQHW
jgi:hypothetical protein